MNKHVLLITQHGLDDQVLMLPLLTRLQQEWPGVSVRRVQLKNCELI